MTKDELNLLVHKRILRWDDSMKKYVFSSYLDVAMTQQSLLQGEISLEDVLWSIKDTFIEMSAHRVNDFIAVAIKLLKDHRDSLN
jgi:hypothetical protein